MTEGLKMRTGNISGFGFKRLVVVPALILGQLATGSLAFAHDPNQTDNGPSLTSTMAFIVEKMSVTHEDIRPHYTRTFSANDIAVSPSRCVLTWTSHVDYHDCDSDFTFACSEHVSTHVIVDLSGATELSKIDGATVQVGGGYIRTNDEKTAARVARAADHAAQLCKGSKQEPF